MRDNYGFDLELLDELIVGRVEPHIYAFSTETVPNYLKVGDTYRPVKIRLKEWEKYFPNLVKRFQGVAKVDEEVFFRDFAVHKYLEEDVFKERLLPESIKSIPYYSREFFKDALTEDLEEAIIDIKKSHRDNDAKYQFYRFEDSRIPLVHTYNRIEDYEPRPNQKVTINNFKKALEKGRTNLLMYAVMRFGKSFTSMCCAVEMEAKIVLIVSAKADVKIEWKKTVESHKKFEGFNFLDSNSLLEDNEIIKQKIEANEKVALFLTLQDLQGDEIKEKHKEVFENQIDLLLIDETHFGARAAEYGKVLRGFKKTEVRNELKLNDEFFEDLEEGTKVINSKIRIHLSGTPYRILMNSEFSKDDIIAFYQFTDIAEDQKSWNDKFLMEDDVKEWENPYYGFPQMIRFAFNPNESSIKKMEELKKAGITYAFSELLKPKSILRDKKAQLHREFIYEKEIIDLFKVIDGSQKDEGLLGFLDYDKLKDGNMCRHLVCVLPYRASCDALEYLLKTNDFKNLNSYEIINISGVENEKLFKDTNSVKNKIVKCDKEGIKTITLTVNRMLTGSTVPQWDTMLYLKDTASPQEYDQAIFRLQSQYIKTYKEPGGDEVKYNMKPQTLLVDFNPNRMFRMQEQKSKIYNVNTESNGNTRLEERIEKELQVSPIIVLNNKKMVEIEPVDILDAIREYSKDRSVLDEATSISIDYSLLEIEAIRLEIERQNKIGSKGGFEIKSAKGEGDDIDTGGKDEEPKNLDDKGEKSKKSEEEEKKDYRGKFAMYYARILFYSFLIDSQVRSLQEIIDSIDQTEDNLRISSNLDLEKDILMLFQKHINPFVLNELDYKIYNINSLANDVSVLPINRASNAMKKFSRLSDSEIVTPEIITEKMINAISEETFTGSTKVLDIASKQGEFVYAVYKKYGKEVANNLYSIPTSKTAYEFTRKVYKLLDLNVNNIESNYNSYDLIEENDIIKENAIKINNEIMKFDAIVGNPPYHVNDGGAGASARPIYQEFVEKVKQLSPKKFTVIMPTRWYAGGKGLNKFREEMLNDPHISELHDFLYPESIFPEINLRGGICFFLWDKEYNNRTDFTKVFNYQKDLNPIVNERALKTEGSDILIRHKLAIDIMDKVWNYKGFVSLEKFISPRKPFGLEANIIKNKNIFKDDKKGMRDPVLCYGRNQSSGFVEREVVLKNKEWINLYKVFTPRANNIGTELNDDNLNTFIGEPNTICTESYIVVGTELELNRKSASNLGKYFKTKFSRFQHSIGKASQDATSKTYKFVPLQDFTSKSDINWNKPIPEIDEQLYEKYKLTDKEIEFIETMIKPMG